MKHILTFEEFILERKEYGQKITNKEFANIAIGSTVLYSGDSYIVKSNNGYILSMTSVKRGTKEDVNLNMFNQKGAILEEGKIFEAEFGNERVVIFPGRFQPFHNGHIAALKKAHDIFRLPVVPIQILSKNDKSPFDEGLLMSIGKAVAKEFNWMGGYSLYPPGLKTVVPQMIKYLRAQFNYEPVGMGCGSDRLKAYEPQIKYLNSDRTDVPVSEPFRLEICDERAPGGPSGTKVREAIIADDVKLFEELTPKSVHKFYKDLKKSLS